MFNLDQETFNELIPTPTAEEVIASINAKLSDAHARLTQASYDVEHWNTALTTVQAAVVSQAQG